MRTLNPMTFIAFVRMSLDRRNADYKCQQCRHCEQAQSHCYSPHLSSQTGRIQRRNGAETRGDSTRDISSSARATDARIKIYFEFSGT
jgi:hypothetical protein